MAMFDSQKCAITGIEQKLTNWLLVALVADGRALNLTEMFVSLSAVGHWFFNRNKL
jgi:hypothetical protein